MNFQWIILSFQVTLMVLTFCEAGKKGTESGIIVINNTGGGKCGGSAKTIVKTAPKGKKGKGGKGKGHTIIASSGGGGGGGGCSSSCKCGHGDHGHDHGKVVAVPVPVHIPVHDNKFMHRRNTGFESTAGTRMMPVFVSANSPISIAGSPSSSNHQQQSQLNSYGYNNQVGSSNPFINAFASNLIASRSHLRSIGDHGIIDPSVMSMSEARQMFSLLPAQQLGHHFAHSVNHGNQDYGHHSHGLSSPHHHHSFNAYGDSGSLMRDSPVHHPVPYSSMPIYEPIRSEEEYMGMNYGDGRGNHGGSIGHGPSPSPSSSSSSTSSEEDERNRSNYQSASSALPSSAPSSEPLRKPSNFDDSPASPVSSPLSPDSKEKSQSGYWPERA
ncbi:hornerin [Tetranychus urticae]|uniref:hornerin n=1 Tax=Tetranychus urticae TaxID=32264 RepID=UPI00077B8B99|nr:hornerin [Tetranychus urticae]XP_015784926.1 hornerin [Tetranychus urticae]